MGKFQIRQVGFKYNRALEKKMKSINLVIFDCDGVLVNTEPLANRVFNGLLREYGVGLDEQSATKNFSGITIPDRIATIAGEFGWQPPSNFVDLFNERMIELSEEGFQAIPGIKELVESLSIPVCVASNGSVDEIERRLIFSKLKPHFENAVFSGLDMAHPKPAPDVYLAAARAFNVSPAQCLVIEDSLPGITAGVRAGMRVYGYAAYAPSEQLHEAGAIPFSSMQELRKILADEYGIASLEDRQPDHDTAT